MQSHGAWVSREINMNQISFLISIKQETEEQKEAQIEK